jgi:hypothetical protein
MIETAFSRPTFVIADNAEVPIRAKLSRLEKYSREGDIIILPLEWQYYLSDWYPPNFINNMINVKNKSGFSSYYYSLSTTDKIKFVLYYINFKYIFYGLKRRSDEPSLAELNSQYRFVIEKKENNVYGDFKSDADRVRTVFGKNCRQYVNAEGTAAEIAHQMAERLSALQTERKVRVILTWPAVAGNQCYDPESVGKLAGQVRAIFSKAGIAVVGTPEDSYFSDDHVLNTFYHIDMAAAKERTRRLIEALKGQGLAPSPERYPSTREIANSALAQEEAEMIGRLSQVRDGTYRPGSEEFFRHFLLLEGWYGIEGWGVWSRGVKSTITLRTGGGSCTLTLNSEYYGNSRPSRILVNGQLIESDDGAPIPLPANETVRLQFEHHDVTSPRAAGQSSDPREIAYAIKAISVKCLTAAGQHQARF